jgi:hypothetical protein
MVMDLTKLGTGTAPKYVKLSDVDMTSLANGGALIGNQKRIDMNKNGKIDAEDFEIMRNTMDGAWRKDRKYVNSTSRKNGKLVDYEVQYARKNNPLRKGYKGKRNFATGGAISERKRYTIGDLKNLGFKQFKGDKFYYYYFEKDGNKYEFRKIPSIGINSGVVSENDTILALVKKYAKGGGISKFERLSRSVAKNYEGKRVKPQYQKEYGKVYSKTKAKEVGNKVAGKVKANQKMSSGAEVKKTNRGGVMVLAKKIRKDGESWKDALKRAGQQLK